MHLMLKLSGGCIQIMLRYVHSAKFQCEGGDVRLDIFGGLRLGETTGCIEGGGG